MFSRNRKLIFSNLILFIIKLKGAIQRELDEFYKSLRQSDFKIREITKGGLTQARAKLNEWAFVRLNEMASNTFYDEAGYYKWHGMRTLAVDGIRLMLPNHPSIIKEFGQHNFGPKADSPRSMAMASMLYDVLNQVTIDAQIAPYAASEIELLSKHLDKAKKGDLLLLDRGYPSFWLLFMLQAKGIEFCVRLKDNWWVKVKEFSESGKKERIVSFILPKKDRRKLTAYPNLQDTAISRRLVKVELESGKKEILCNSPTDT